MVGGKVKVGRFQKDDADEEYSRDILLYNGNEDKWTVANGQEHPDHAKIPPKDHFTKHGWWYDFAHPDAKWNSETDSKACNCIPGYHEAKDVKCHVDAFGHLRVTHPEMACADDKWRTPNPTTIPYGATHPDHCVLRHWRGTGATHHHCVFKTSTTCSCCDCKDGAPHKCPAGTHRNAVSPARKDLIGRPNSPHATPYDRENRRWWNAAENKWSTAVRAKFFADAAEAGACPDCQPGRFTDAENEMLACKPCAKGRFGDAVADTPARRYVRHLALRGVAMASAHRSPAPDLAAKNSNQRWFPLRWRWCC